METKETKPKERLIRPVKCHFCNCPMFYGGDERHEPEIAVSINTTGTYDCDSDELNFQFYAHVRCWNEKMRGMSGTISTQQA